MKFCKTWGSTNVGSLVAYFGLSRHFCLTICDKARCGCGCRTRAGLCGEGIWLRRISDKMGAFKEFIESWLWSWKMLSSPLEASTRLRPIACWDDDQFKQSSFGGPMWALKAYLAGSWRAYCWEAWGWHAGVFPLGKRKVGQKARYSELVAGLFSFGICLHTLNPCTERSISEPSG